ncbi:MAG: cyclopropane fatty acyl phospholipid synthase [Planctomycetota bacterium]|jgi:cyclopropane-fatty-acyl-phospholipid synthase
MSQDLSHTWTGYRHHGVNAPDARPDHPFAKLMARAGVRVNGPNPWDLRVHRKGLYRRLLLHGSLGFGESYMDGWWDCEYLDEFFHKVFRAQIEKPYTRRGQVFKDLLVQLINLQSRARAFRVGEHHYDIGNDIYRSMLDKRMIYSCGYWNKANNLDEAQEAKLDLTCHKLGLQPGMKVLDIGCGWGGAARFAAERCGVEVIGVTVSREQARLAEENCRGLPITIRLEDYRDLTGVYDRIFSIGMFEHVGYKNYKTYLRAVRRRLSPDGLFLLQTIGNNQSVTDSDPWMDRYIFPNSMIPSAKQIANACEGLFVIEDWHGFGPDYDKTLMQWYQNFQDHWPELRDRYGDRFYRMWTFYLLSCAGAFRARKLQLWQIVLSPNGVPGGYVAPR